MLLIGMFTSLRGIMRIAHVRDEFVPQEFKIRAGPGNNLTLMHQTLFPTERISLLLQYIFVCDSKNTQLPSRAVSEPTRIWRWPPQHWRCISSWWHLSGSSGNCRLWQGPTKVVGEDRLACWWGREGRPRCQMRHCNGAPEGTFYGHAETFTPTNTVSFVSTDFLQHRHRSVPLPPSPQPPNPLLSEHINKRNGKINK